MPKPKSMTKNIHKFLITILILLNFFLIGFSLNPTLAQNSGTLQPASREEVSKILDSIGKSSCPDPIKNLFVKQDGNGNWVPRGDNSDYTFYLNGTAIVARDANGQAVYLTCASASAFQKIAIRGVVMLFSLIGLFLAFGAGRSAIAMIFAFGDEEKFREGVKGLITAVSYTIGVLFFYTFLVFILVGILGFGNLNAKQPEYNLFCQQRIIFNLTFDQSEPC